jgi:hypothetical protein
MSNLQGFQEQRQPQLNLVPQLQQQQQPPVVQNNLDLLQALGMQRLGSLGHLITPKNLLQNRHAPGTQDEYTLENVVANTTRVEEEMMEKGNEIQLETRIPCRAGGMPSDHNFQVSSLLQSNDHVYQWSDPMSTNLPSPF